MKEVANTYRIQMLNNHHLFLQKNGYEGWPNKFGLLIRPRIQITRYGTTIECRKSRFAVLLPNFLWGMYYIKVAWPPCMNLFRQENTLDDDYYSLCCLDIWRWAHVFDNSHFWWRDWPIRLPCQYETYQFRRLLQLHWRGQKGGFPIRKKMADS